jgi:hypothetical protein
VLAFVFLGGEDPRDFSLLCAAEKQNEHPRLSRTHSPPHHTSLGLISASRLCSSVRRGQHDGCTASFARAAPRSMQQRAIIKGLL